MSRIRIPIDEYNSQHSVIEAKDWLLACAMYPLPISVAPLLEDLVDFAVPAAFIDMANHQSNY